MEAMVWLLAFSVHVLDEWFGLGLDVMDDFPRLNADGKLSRY